MANDAAWQAGVDIGSGRRGKKKDDASPAKGADSSQSSKPVGGLLGLAKKGVQAGIAKMRGKGKAPAGASDASSGITPGQLSSTPAATFLPGTMIPSGRHGGRVRKTGIVHVHRGEEIIPAKHAKKMRKRTTIKR